MDPLAKLYETVKIDKKPDPNILKAQEEAKLASIEKKHIFLEEEINTAMETIAKNKDKGYCIIRYGYDPSDVVDKLEKAGFDVTRQRFMSLVGQRGCQKRYSLIVSWQEFDDATYEKIVDGEFRARKSEFRNFMGND
jgi:hypothetical protein